MSAAWHDLSDVKLAAALNDRFSFRRFYEFSCTEPTPERTTFVRFRQEIVRRDLDQVPFKEVIDQLRASSFKARMGRMVDATVTVGSVERDDEAGGQVGQLELR